MEKGIRERGATVFFLGKIYMPPESKSTVKEVQKNFGEISVDLQKHKRQGEVVVVGDLNSIIGKSQVTQMRTLHSLEK